MRQVIKDSIILLLIFMMMVGAFYFMEAMGW